MVKAIIIIGSAVLFLSAAFFVFFGFKKSSKRGIRNICIVVGTTLAALLASAILPLGGLISQLTAVAEQSISGFGVDGSLFGSVLSGSIDKLIRQATVSAVFLVLFILSVIAAAIFDHIYKPNSSKKSSKAVTVICSALSGIYLLAFAFFATPINVAEESDNIQTITTVLTEIDTQSGDYTAALTNADLLIDVLMSTKIVAGNENDKLQLINKAIASGAARSADPMVASLLSGMSFESVDQLKADTHSLTDVMRKLVTAGLADLLTGNTSVDNIKKLTEYEDKESLVDTLYSTSFSDPIIHTLMSQGIRTVTGDAAFVYPENVKFTSDTKGDFLTMMNNLTAIYVTANDPAITDKVSAFAPKLAEIKSLPIVPNDVYDKIDKVFRKNGV
ncbi:MAG: hypothetical protein LBL87_03350 [Ruminococcus sp.]|jgi:hypothetical protein|nr:hypothetical protein [Ruminococcus sp.]